MMIAEVYRSLQGEGLLAGTPSTFVRTSGCNLRCHWCDTPFTSWQPTGDDRSVAELLDMVVEHPCQHIVVTGGEPLIATETLQLCHALRNRGCHVTIETAGSVLPPGLSASELGSAGLTSVADLFSISPKLSSSTPTTSAAGGWRLRHEAARRRDDVIVQLVTTGSYQLKFVIDSPADLEEAKSWIDVLARQVEIDPLRVLVMPQGVDLAVLTATTSWLEPASRAAGMRFVPRHHVAWFGHVRGT